MLEWPGWLAGNRLTLDNKASYLCKGYLTQNFTDSHFKFYIWTLGYWYWSTDNFWGFYSNVPITKLPAITSHMKSCCPCATIFVLENNFLMSFE